MNNTGKYKCLIVDDEPPARDILHRYVRDTPMLELCGEYSNALQALHALNDHPVDLLFLDIQMPKISGIELIKTLKTPPRIILTTAFEQYAIQAFELDVIDYLLKPIRFDRFLKAVTKALSSQTTPVPATPQKTTSDIPFLYVRENRKMVKIMLDDIVYIESLRDYIRVFTITGPVITKYSMAAMEAMLPNRAFLRVHRSFIVAMKRISAFSPETLHLGPHQVPVGKIYRQLVIRALAK
jgi:DNA-binding LytR/AlgR family response regulator